MYAIMKSKTHYDILDVSSSATQSEIKAAYQILVRVWHPDRLHGDLKEIGESKMKLINSAYEVLKDPKQKDAYDSNMRRGQRPQSPTPPSSPSSAHTRPAPTPRTQATSTPPKSAPPKAPPKPPQYGKASKQFRESVVASVDDYFSVLIEENPNHIRDLLIVLNYQIKQEATATWKCEETGENEEPALLRWAQQAKSAGDEAVKLRDQVAYSVNFYYDDLIEKNPTRREDLLSALNIGCFS
jgi:curved DNA-binding protein CbpA